MRHVLDKRIRLCLARLELLSYGAVAALDSSGGKGKPTGGDKPKGWRAYRDDDECEVPHLRYRMLYEAAADNLGREGVCEAAEACLRAWTEPRRVEVQGETLEALKARILKEGQGWSVKDAALGFRVTESFVRKARLEKNREPLFGLPVVKERPADAEQRVRQLSARGVSVRDIATQVGVSKSSVQRMLADAGETL